MSEIQKNQNKIDEKDQKQKIKEEEEMTEQYLSSNNLDGFKNEEETKNEEVETKYAMMKDRLYFLIQNIILFLVFTFYPIYLIPFGIYGITCYIRADMPMSYKISNIIQGLWLEICCSSILYSLIIFIFFPIENEIIRYFQLDAIYFYLTSTLVFSYIRTNYSKRPSFQHILSTTTDYYSITTNQYFNSELDDRLACFMDYDNQEIEQKLLTEEMIKQRLSKIPLGFSCFLDNIGETNKFEKSISSFIGDFSKYILPNFKSFYFLIGIIFLKLFICFHYIFVQVSDISIKEYFDMFVVIFLYINTTFNLNRILGNNDLRRKYVFMVKQNEYIDFKNISEQQINLKEKLDFLCPISLESWDNTRKFILAYKNSWLETLELSYFCLLFYFIFATLVCLSSYFELHWIFVKGSVLLSPIIVIMSSFDFIFLSVFFLIRFYEGNKFNDTFEDLNQSLDYLIDAMQDLQAMFDEHFNHKTSKTYTEKEDRKSIYGIIVKKMKLLSKYYIKNEMEYQGRKYSEKQKSELRKKFLKNSKLTLQKIKSSLVNDSQLHKYKFLNLIEVNFADILFTLIFALVTTLPTIVPKFIELYTNENTE